jgi:hypothetical protein
MSSMHEHLSMVACGIPCEGCPVGNLDLQDRMIVDGLLSMYGPELEYDESIYPWRDSEADKYEIPEDIMDMTKEAIGSSDDETTTTTRVNAVARAITKIVNEGCATYSEGEI